MEIYVDRQETHSRLKKMGRKQNKMNTKGTRQQQWRFIQHIPISIQISTWLLFTGVPFTPALQPWNYVDVTQKSRMWKPKISQLFELDIDQTFLCQSPRTKSVKCQIEPICELSGWVTMTKCWWCFYCGWLWITNTTITVIVYSQVSVKNRLKNYN